MVLVAFASNSHENKIRMEFFLLFADRTKAHVIQYIYIYIYMYMPGWYGGIMHLLSSMLTNAL